MTDKESKPIKLVNNKNKTNEEILEKKFQKELEDKFGDDLNHTPIFIILSYMLGKGYGESIIINNLNEYEIDKIVDKLGINLVGIFCNTIIEKGHQTSFIVYSTNYRNSVDNRIKPCETTLYRLDNLNYHPDLTHMVKQVNNLENCKVYHCITDADLDPYRSGDIVNKFNNQW